MSVFTIQEVKIHLSQLLDRVRQGEEIIISKGRQPIARLVPVIQKAKRQTPGTARGKIRIHKNFDAPLPKKIRDALIW